MTVLSSARAVALAVVACAATGAPLAAPSYHLVDLGANTGASAINQHGAIAGVVDGAAAIWRDGRWHRRPAGSAATDIDDHGEVSGRKPGALEGTLAALYWPRGGGPIDVVPPIAAIQTLAVAVGGGRVAGYAQAFDYSDHCMVWSPADGPLEIVAEHVGPFCTVADMNEAGQVVGDATAPGGLSSTAFLWQDGVTTWLGALPGGTGSSAAAINRKGHVAVSASRALANGGAVSHAALWNGRRMVDLGAMSRGGIGRPSALNNHDDVVGEEFGPHITRTAFLYTGGSMLPLMSLVDNIGDWVLYAPQGIADDGTIVGSAAIGAVQHAYMLVPATPLH